jgi:hypothetical protein
MRGCVMLHFLSRKKLVTTDDLFGDDADFVAVGAYDGTAT